MKKRFLTATLLSAFCFAGITNAQDADPVSPFEGLVDLAPEFEIPEADETEIPSPVQAPRPEFVMDRSAKSDSDVRNSMPTAAELRQARAIYRTQQRLGRMERNLWMGYEPLRPGWSAVHSMQSRYPYQRNIWVPVYYTSR